MVVSIIAALHLLATHEVNQSDRVFSEIPARGCQLGLGEIAASRAKAAFPSLKPDQGVINNREAFLDKHFKELFDPNGTGFLDVDRYSAYEWASILVRIPPGVCTLDFDTFLLIAYGVGADVKATEAGEPYLRQAWYRSFKNMDTGHKGFLDWRDYAKISAQSFRKFDKNRDGRVTFAEFFGHNH